MTKMLTGRMPTDKEFEREHKRMLAQLGEHLRPGDGSAGLASAS